MLTLWCDGRAVATCAIAESLQDRSRGLLGVDGVDGALLIRPALSVHTVRMRFALDVAFVDRALRVLTVVTMAPNRLGLPRLRSKGVLEAEAGRFQQWGLRRGSVLAITDAADAVPATRGTAG